MSGIALDGDVVEALAEQLYGASNTTSVPWAKRDRLVRSWWRKAAEEQLISTEARRRTDAAG